MEYTENYHLNQWDATDRVLRTDFNSDNQKIDAALAEIKCQRSLTLLQEYKVTESGQEIEFPLDIDWNEWKAVHIQCEAFTNEDRTTVYVDLGSNTVLEAWGNQAEAEHAPYLGYAILLPLYDARRHLIYCDTNGYTGIGWVVGDSTFASLYPRLTLTAYRNANVNAGTTVTFWGER